MSQNIQTFDPNRRFIDPCGLAHEHLPALSGEDGAEWEIQEFDAADEAELDELTKLFVPFEPDFD